MLHRRWIGVALAAGVCLAGAMMPVGCGGKEAGEKAAEEIAEKVAEAAGGGKVDVEFDEGKISMKTEDFQMESEAASEWPSDLPGDVPEFTYGEVERVARGAETSGGERSYNVWVRDVDPRAVAKYEADLKQAGYQTTTVDMGAQGGMVNAQKEGLAIHFTHARDEQRGNIIVTVD